jgi:hypothetical protein
MHLFIEPPSRFLVRLLTQANDDGFYHQRKVFVLAEILHAIVRRLSGVRGGVTIGARLACEAVVIRGTP